LLTRATNCADWARRRFAIFAWAWITLSVAWGQPAKVTHPIDISKTEPLHGSRPALALLQNDLGPLSPSRRISGITLVLKPAEDQIADLNDLLQQQQAPSSPNYHNWLTPEQYADRFGLAQSDLDQVIAWLEDQGFQVDYLARSRTWIMFSGTAAQVFSAFHTQIHEFNSRGKLHFANLTDPSIPVAFDAVIALIRGLDDFRAEPRKLKIAPIPDFTSGGSHSLVPGDIAAIYDINPLYQSGVTGSGQKIAVVGQTDINLSDIEHFRSVFGLPANDPQLVLVTGSQNPGVSAGDLIESSLDLEYSGAIAPNATIQFVYSTDVWTSLTFAVDQAIAPVISMSYGYCEPQISSEPASTAAYFRSVAQQANSFGITWLAASGDSGAADCDVGQPPVATQGLAVELPASVPEVTGVGGSEFMEGSGHYWASTNNANGSSALSYIPEMAWNDTPLSGGLASTGGGASIFFSKPSWQSGVGVPNDSVRDVPDLSFSAANDHDPYQIYANGQGWYVGGTSVSTPVFSGVLALLNQYLLSGSQAKVGLGNVNPALYRLSQTTTGIFHDITVGNNVVPCQSGTPNCTNGQMGYSAGVGYDQATGLGSLDAYNFVTRWNASASVATATNITANHGSITQNSSALLTATVTAASGTTTPTGSVSFTLGQTLLGTTVLSGSGGIATASLSVTGSQLAAGANTVKASYTGSAAFTGSSGSISITVTTGIPAAVSATPSSGSSASQSFALQYSDTAGVASLQNVYVYFSATLGNPASNSCFLYYNVAANQINLLNDGGTAYLMAAPGAATTLQNSQCSLNLAATTVVMNGNALTLNLAMTFKTAYAGAKNIYLYARDVSGTTSGWQTEGTWTVPSASGTPAVVSATPSSGAGASQNFGLKYSDSAGTANLRSVYAYFNATLANPATNSCFLYYNVAANQINLLNDTSTAYLTATPGTAATLQNSQCSLNVAATTVAVNGNTLTLNLAMTAKPEYAGTKNVYLYATDASGSNSGWQTDGTWTVPSGSGTPGVVSVTPNSGSVAAQSFAFLYSDTAGAANLRLVYVYFNATLANPASQSCFLYYNVATNQINLLNDGSTAYSTTTPGATTTLQNSQCSLNAGATSVVLSGNVLTLNLAITFAQVYAGAKNIYLYATDVSGANSGWQSSGTWNVP